MSTDNTPKQKPVQFVLSAVCAMPSFNLDFARGAEFYANFMLMRAGKITPSHFISSPKINILKKIDLFGKNLYFCHGNVSSATRRLVCDTLVTAVHNFFCQFTGTNHQSLIDTKSSKYFRQCNVGLVRKWTDLLRVWNKYEI